MPLTQLPYPIVFQFLCTVQKTTGMPANPLDAETKVDGSADSAPKPLLKGVVLGPDGRPYASFILVMVMATDARQMSFMY